MRILRAAVAASLLAAPANASAPLPPKELAAVRQALVKAVGAKDWNAIAALTNWPLAVDNYGSPPTLSKAAFLKKPRSPFFAWFGDGDADLLHCVSAGPVEHQTNRKRFGFGDWIVDCNGSEFYFGLRGGRALFTAYQNINE